MRVRITILMKDIETDKMKVLNYRMHYVKSDAAI